MIYQPVQPTFVLSSEKECCQSLRYSDFDEPIFGNLSLR
jgi:hypothetical protein